MRKTLCLGKTTKLNYPHRWVFKYQVLTLLTINKNFTFYIFLSGGRMLFVENHAKNLCPHDTNVLNTLSKDTLPGVVKYIFCCCSYWMELTYDTKHETCPLFIIKKFLFIKKKQKTSVAKGKIRSFPFIINKLVTKKKKRKEKQWCFLLHFCLGRKYTRHFFSVSSIPNPNIKA